VEEMPQRKASIMSIASSLNDNITIYIDLIPDL
jgi:hypothetical protein